MWTDEQSVLLEVGRTTYRPTAALRDFVQARDKTCVFPGCSMSARRGDLDHTTAFPGSPAAPENPGVMCRAHHRLKQDRRWVVFQPSPGSFEWTTPSGRTYVREPVAA
jgi:hypothetical protein